MAAQEIDVDKKYRNNVVISIVVKGLSIFLSLITVNVYLEFLGSYQYGVWLTISSIASWIAVGDLGIGNGLRNELAKAYAEKDKLKQEKLIETSFAAFIRLSIALLIILTSVSEIMIMTDVIDRSVRIPLYITNIFTCINFVLGILGSIANAYQYGFMSSITTLLYSMLNVVFVILLAKSGIIVNLTSFAIINGLTNTGTNIILYCGLKKSTGLCFRIGKKPDSEILKKITSIGIQFFILQLCCLVLYATDNVIINKLFGGEEVTRYSIITKVYNTGNALFSILLVSFWSAVTYQYSKKNYIWILSKTKQLLNFWMFYSCGVIGVSFLFNYIVKIWLGKNAFWFEADMIAVFAIYSIAGMFGAIFVNISNGIGIIKLQMIMSGIEALINIPLSIFLAQNLSLGIMGVKIATLICCTGANVIMPIYIYSFLRKKIAKQE